MDYRLHSPWMGESYSKKLSELSLVDSDSTGREEHPYIGHSSGWAKIFELGGFEVGNFEKKNVFSPNWGGGARTPFKGLSESTNHKLLFGIQNFSICGTPLPYDSSNVETRKIGQFFFLNPIYWALRTCQPNFFCSAVF